MATQISVVAHRMSASFFAARSAIETAFAALESGEAPDTRAVSEAVTHALRSIDQAGDLQRFEADLIAREALQLAENLREFVGNWALDKPRWICHTRFMRNAGILEPRFHNEDLAFAHVEATRWPNGPVCPHCESENQAYKITGKPGSAKPARRGLYKCKVCKKQFTVLVNSIFSDSHIPLHKWLFAMHLMCSSKKGMSAYQLWRNLWGEHADGKTKGSYRSARFMCHRIRWAMTQHPMTDLLGGSVEVDECYIGGKERGKRGIPGPDSKKTPGVSFVKRGGDVRSFQIDRVTLKNIKPLLKNISRKRPISTRMILRSITW